MTDKGTDWVHGHATTYDRDNRGTFIATDADYFHLYVTRNGRAMLKASCGTLAEAKAVASRKA